MLTVSNTVMKTGPIIGL